MCQRMWCGRCYTSNPNHEFHVSDPEKLFSEEGDEDRLKAGWTHKDGDRNRYSNARDGDDLLVCFECDFCVFGKLKSRLPMADSSEDDFLMACIRRVILDAFWSRARSTVNANTSRAREMVRMSHDLGFNPPFEEPGPLPSHDHVGYRLAILMVAKSVKSGRHSETHVQWDTIRKFKSTHSNQSRSAKRANQSSLSLANYKGSNYDRISHEECGSIWFQRFTTGCRRRMGQDWRPNRALSNPLIHRVLNLTESRILLSTSKIEREKWVIAGAYFCFCYVLSLRSPEGLMVDLPGLFEFSEKRVDCVVIPLLGQVKGEDHTRHHLLHCVNRTKSGIHVRAWVKRLRALHSLNRRTSGPAFINSVTGLQCSTSEMNDLFQELLAEIFEEDRELFGIDIHAAADLPDKYNVFRSFRRGSESRAVSENVSEPDRYVVNRWRKKEKAGSGKVNHSIDQLYVDVSLAKDPFLRYTEAM
jgi:hypothetical protein